MKNVMVIQSERLLAEGILHLLNRVTDIKVFNTMCDDAVTLLQEIQDIKPNVLVLEECSQLTDHPSFFSLLGGYPDMRVIVIDEHENRMHIYRMQEIEIERSADLVAAIRDGEQLPYDGQAD
jgi:DNA-binding NarL/FixJ family response regulator